MGMSLWQKAVVVLLGVAIFGGSAYFARIAFRPPGLERYNAIARVTYVHPNVKKLTHARALADKGDLSEARAILVKALVAAPNSPVTRDLRDLLGDINTQIFFSKEPSPGKTEYTVKRGDALVSIARKLESSTEAIIRVNDLDSTLIRTGEKLLIPQLDFTITIDLPRDRIIVHDSRGFFTQYPIVSAELPRGRQATIHTKVTAKSFWQDGKPVRPSQGLQNDSTPRINLGRTGYVLYGVNEDDDTNTSEIDVEADNKNGISDARLANRPPRGIVMLKDDITEVDLLIRKGTPVTVILDPKALPLSASRQE